MARILIVDDHAFFRRGLGAALEGHGHVIAGSVGDGEAALGELANNQFDLVLLDIRMRGMNGVEVTQAMRARHDQTPVIVLSAELTDDALVGLMRASVNGIVFKHCSEQRVFEAIDAVGKGLRYIDGSLVDRAFALSSTGLVARKFDSLNAREQEVAALAIQGMRNRQIAATVGISEGMVKLYLHKAYQKLGVGSRTELAALLRESAR